MESRKRSSTWTKGRVKGGDDSLWQHLRAAQLTWSRHTESSGGREKVNSQMLGVFGLAEDSIKDVYDTDIKHGKDV